jgi:hypothetical protein
MHSFIIYISNIALEDDPLLEILANEFIREQRL